MSLKISLIAGSHRQDPESARVAAYVEKVLRHKGVEATYLLNLAGNPLPLWDEEVWSGSQKWTEAWGPVEAELRSSDAFVVVAPEWSGMVPAGLKNFFLLCGTQVLAHKPAMIVSVSAGLGGSYPVAELRMSSYKNTRVCYIPDHVIVRNVGNMLKRDQPSGEEDAALRERIDYTAALLLEYAQAMRTVRESGLVDLNKYPYGM